MKTLPETIVERSRLLPKGGMLTAKDFLHLASRAAVDQALSRLAKSGLLQRAARGLYIQPLAGAKRLEKPTNDQVVRSLAAKTLEVITVGGERSASTLGLTSKAPNDKVFLTSGRSRTLQLDDVIIEIRHVPRWMLSLGDTTAGAVIRALAWAGKARVKVMMVKLRNRLSSNDWLALSSASFLLPSWMAEAIGREADVRVYPSAEF